MQTSAQSTSALAHTFRERLEGFLTPFLTRLDEHVDSRLVRTLGATVEVLLRNRSQGSGLLLPSSAPSSCRPDMLPRERSG